MELIRNFTKLGKDDAPIAGGKGASLGEMTQAGIPVPPGFVVLSQAFEQFLHETSLAEEIDAAIDAVDHKEIHTVEKASETIKELILSREIPQDIKTEIEKNFAELNTQFVAVRSSATAEDGKDHAWAGQLESYLNTTEADLLEKVKHCWASLFTSRAIFYRFEKGLHNTKISVAVVVQKMVESEVSGIAFSVHPVTEDHNQLIIEAGFGLGEAIVSGTVTPDSYIVEKNPRRIIDINVAEQVKGLYRVASVSNGGNEWRDLGEKGKTQVLTETQILELSEIILNIEKHYGFPCDIEWAYEAGKFYIVQSRPITTLSAKVQTVQTCSLNYADYVQLFSGNSMSFLMSDLFIQYYKHLDGLTTFAHNKWTSWLPKKRMEKTLQEGIELFGNKEAFEKFKKEITEYYDSAFTVFESILSRGHLSKEDCALFLKKMTENFEHYSKTEFFYVDEAFKISEGNNVIKDNFKDFEEIKNGSRLKVNKMFFQPDSYRKQFMAKVGTQFNLTKDQVSTYGRDDILALCDGVRLSDQMVEERLKSYLMKGDSGNVEYSYGDVSEKIVDDFFSQATSNLDNILKGVVAHSGKAKGRAAVIKYGDNMFQRLPEIIRDMPQGSILVTDTTSPELFMACKKASAIVTNQGGMMSHAAIVSRELNIPCLVGVGVATDRINDGDMIEVDADNGIVRILTTVTSEGKAYLNINPEDYAGTGQWVAPVLEFELWLDWSTTADASQLGFPRETYPWISIDGHFFRKKDDAYVFIRDHVYSEFKDGKYDFTLSLIQKAEELSKLCIDASEQIHGPLSFPDFLKYFELMHKLRFPWMSFFAIDQGSSKYLEEYAEKNNLNADDILASVPQLPNTVTEDQKRLVEFKQKIEALQVAFNFDEIEKKDKELARELVVYQKETEYIGTHHLWGDPRSMERLLSAIEHIHEQQDVTNQDGGKYPFADIFSLMTKWRLECAQSSARLAYALRPTLEKFAKNAGITYDDIIQLTTKEIEDLLNGDTQSLSDIKERYKKFTFFKSGDKISILTGKAYDDVAAMFGLNQNHGAVDVITGSVGNKGRVTGIVAIVTRPQENIKVKKGMILVAPETTPDFIPSMGIAAAFVTDFGGITSHAAIVAREMNKPCIIGTKIATRVLKDGDLVEVDADNGVVRILTENKPNPLFIDGKNWFPTVTRNMSFWHQGLCNEGTCDHAADFGMDYKLHAMSLTVDSTQTTIFVYKENFDGYCKAIVSATDSVEKVLALKEKYQTFGKELLDSLAACTENINAETFINFMNAYRKYTAGLMITTSLGRIHHEIYIAKLKELGYDDSQIASVIATTTYPVEKTPFFNSQIDLLKIGIEIQDNHADETRVNSLIVEWMSKHAFVPVNFCEEPYSEMDLRNLLEEVLKNNCQEKLDSLERQHEESIENANKELEKIADAEVNRLSKTLAEITTINEFRKNVFCKTSLGYRPIFTFIAQKLGSDNWRDIFYLTSEEILKVLNGETLSLDQVVQSRKKVAMYINDEGKLTFLDTATTQGLYDVVYSSPKTNLESSKIIKGLSANKGKVKGVAKVILSSKEFSKLLPNEILVTTMTSVDFVPIMERAAAFITNEGGITSHASIVARELNKPCIIGTKNATQIIKDGDIVEVDADKGIITIF